MIDKGHSIINSEGEAYLEYSDFYDFSTSYPDFEMIDNEDTPVKSDHKIWVRALFAIMINPLSLNI